MAQVTQSAQQLYDSGQYGPIMNDPAGKAWMTQNYPQAAAQWMEKISAPTANIANTNASTTNTQTNTDIGKATLPGTTANSQADIIKAAQAAAPQNLGKDLANNKMTLGDALKKYTGLKMSPDDIFKQYLSASPWGLPNESPSELQAKGISPQALGQIGQNGSFADKWNTKQAVLGLRDLHNTWNQTTDNAHIPWLGQYANSAKAYNTQKEFVGEHLSSLIPGAAGGESTSQKLFNTLPNTGDETAPGGAPGQFSKAEEGLLNVKGYKYSDLGLTPQLSQILGTNNKPAATPTKGGDILQNGLNDILNIGKSIPGQAAELGKDTLQYGPFAALPAYLAKQAPAIASEYKDLLTNPVQHLQDHPVNTVLDTLPFLSKGLVKGGGGVPGGVVDEGSVTAKLPGALKQYITPGKAINQAGGARDMGVSAATKAGTVVKGADMASSIRNWFSSSGGKEAMGQYPELEEKIENMAKTYEGKDYTPTQLKGIYDKIERTYTQSGLQLTAQDKVLSEVQRQILSDKLGEVAPGWKASTANMAGSYRAQKSPIRTLGKVGIGLGLSSVGLDEIKKVLPFL